MGKRAALIETYAADLREKCGVEPDMELLTKVTIGCGPSIYRADASLVAGSDDAELETIRRKFLIGKLGLPDAPALMEGVRKAIETYGVSNRAKHRPVVYYLLVKHFGKEAVYG